MDLGRVLVVRIVYYYQCLKNGSRQLTIRSRLEHFLQIYQRRLILLHDLLIPKLNSYGFSMSALRFVHIYLKDRMERATTNSKYSSWEEIMFWFPQGSILGSLLFNIFLCYLFLIMENIDIKSYADDNMPYISRNSVEEVTQK